MRLQERRLLVGLGRLELPTSRLSGVRSNQLSYRPRTGTTPIPWKLNRECSTHRPGHGLPLPLQARERPKSLRKEVIQPQVLLQLPCYDFTPIASHTMDSYPPEGLAHRLPVQLTFVM